MWRKDEWDSEEHWVPGKHWVVTCDELGVKIVIDAYDCDDTEASRIADAIVDVLNLPDDAVAVPAPGLR